MVRCKFRLYEKTEMENYSADESTPFRVKLIPCMGEPFGKYTPCGSIEFTVKNDEAAKELQVGKEYYVDFTSVEK